MVLRAVAIILLLGISVLGERVFARALLDLEAAYLQDTIQAAETANRIRSVFGGGVYVPLDNREKYFLGASFLTGSLVEGQTTGTLQMTTQDLVLAARWIVDRDRTFHLVAGFGPFTQASYRAPAATATELWNGTSMYFRFVAAPEVKGRLNIGMSFTYYSATFVKREVSNTTSTINYSASYLLPGLALSFLW